MADRKNNETTSWNADEVRRQQTQRKQRKKMRRTRFWAIYCAGVVLGSCLLAGLGWLMVNDVCALNKAPLTATVEIEKGDSVGQIASKLKKAGIIKYKLLFVITSPLFHAKDTIQPGSYELNTDMDYNCIIDSMQQGSSVAGTVKVTIPEGYTVAQIFQLLEEKGVATVEDLNETAATHDYAFSFLQDIPLGDPERLEGYLFPATYEFYTPHNPLYAINKMLQTFDAQFTDEMRQEVADSGRTIHEVLTVASMIEKETDGEDRGKIASVIYNRLNNPGASAGTNGYLQIDATLAYLNGGKVPTEADKSIDSPYNTYLYPGLPPGPIANPGLESIKAAMEPESTSYYYYTLGDDNKHHFFNTYGEMTSFMSTQALYSGG